MNENRHDKMPSHDIDDLFRSAIEPLEDAPPASVWVQVEKDLDRHNIISIKRKYNNLKRIAIALVLILSGTLVYEFGVKQNSSGEIVAGKSEQVIGAKGNPETANKSDAAVSNEATKQTTPPSASQQLTDATVDEAVSVPNASSRPFATPKNERPSTADANIVRSTKNRTSRSPLHELRLPGYNVNNNDRNIVTAAVAPGKQMAETIRSLSFSSPATHSFHHSANEILNKLGNESIDMAKADQMLAVKNMPVKEFQAAKQFTSLSGRRSRFALSVIFSPDFTSRLVKEDWAINREDNKDEIRKSERYAFSYSFGALLEYRVNKHWSVQSGFTLSREMMNIGPKFIFARRDNLGDVKYKFNSSSGYSYFTPHTMSFPVFGDSLHAFGSSSSLMYMGIPVVAKYKVTRKKLELYASAGIAANILVKDKIETSLFKGNNQENAVNHDIRGLKPVYYTALAGVGVAYNINKSLAVNFTPTARIALNSLNKDGPVKSYQQSLGLVAGVQIRF